jgi:CHAT domain-containing protein
VRFLEPDRLVQKLRWSGNIPIAALGKTKSSSAPCFRTLFALLISLCVPAKAQETPPQTTLSEADRLAMLYNWPRALPLYADAEKEFRRLNDPKGMLEARLGWLWAQAYEEPSPGLAAEVDRDLRSPLVQGDAALMLRCLTAKAAIEEEVNEDYSRPTWEKIQELAKRLNDRRWQARAQAELGIIAFLDGDVATATGALKTALVSLYLQGDMGAAIYYGSIVGNGQVEAGEPEAGIKYCETAIQTASTVKDMGFPFMAYEGKARGLIALHRNAEAKQVLDEAIRQAQAQNALAAEAQLLVVRGKQEVTVNAQQAIKDLDAATEFCKQHRFRHALAWGTFELATAYRDQGDFEQAGRYAATAERETEGLEDKYHLPEDLALMADLAAKAGHTGAADSLYRRAGDVTEGLLASVPSRQVEGSLIGVLSNIYVGHFSLAATKLRNVNEAYEVLETARGRSIADALRSEPTQPVQADPITEAARKEVSRIQLALLNETNRGQRANMLERLFQAEQVLTPVGKPESRLQQATIRAHAVGLATLQKSLRPEEMVLEYVLDEPGSFCLHVTRTEAAVTVLTAGRKAIEDLIDRYLAEIRSSKTGAETGAKLYSLLLRPIPGEESSPRLIIIPDGILHLLSFGSLRDAQGRYLLESHVVTYAPSATVLHLIRNSPMARAPTLAFLGVGDVEYSRDRTASNSGSPDSASTVPSADPFDLAGTRFRDLPSTRDEVVAASQVFGEKRLLLGPDATEAAFKAQPLADFQIIHIAAHGIASPRFPDRAALVLGSDPKSGEDGLLQVREIRDLSLNADLVTLSACDTGVGPLEGEEGIANLVRAFLFSGAKAVVASLWTANDPSTRTLMERFYRYIAGGEDKGSALRHGQKDLIAEFGERALPLYWAGFILVGDGSGKIPVRQ